MADRIDLSLGDLPWQPGSGELVETIHRYDMPLAGLIEQHGTTFFFWCIEGEVTQGSLWGYVALGDHEKDSLAGGPRDRILRTIGSAKRPVRLAFSVDGQGIQRWADVDSVPTIKRSYRVLELGPEEKGLLQAV